jgi:hypothetical protein
MVLFESSDCSTRGRLAEIERMRRVRDVLLFSYRDENPQLLERHVCPFSMYGWRVASGAKRIFAFTALRSVADSLKTARPGTARIWRGLQPRSAAYTPENQS